MKSRNASGFSMIDIIIALGIMSVAIVGIQYAQANYIQMSSRVEIGLRAISLGNSVMNTIRMHRFDENTASPWSTTLGTDALESSMADFDDIDDYDGATWDFSAQGFPGFSVSTQVFSVPLGSNWLNAVTPGTNFKRIIVSIDHDELLSPLVFSSIYAGVEG